MSGILEAALGADLSQRLHEFVKKLQADNVRQARRELATAERLDDLEADLGFLAMLQVATLRLLDDKEILKGDELVAHLAMADRLDGVEDGALSVSAVREVIGLPRVKRSEGKPVGWAPRAAPAAPRAPAPAARAARAPVPPAGRPKPALKPPGPKRAPKPEAAAGRKAKAKAKSGRKKTWRDRV